ncbi:MAG: hypothetical protein R6X16_01910 [Anaerolineae bacterium]
MGEAHLLLGNEDCLPAYVFGWLWQENGIADCLRSLVADRRFQFDLEAEWAEVLRDLDALTETEVAASDGKRFVIRSESRGWCGKTYQAAGVAMAPTLRLAGAAVSG